jgi:hypothetical protein
VVSRWIEQQTGWPIRQPPGARGKRCAQIEATARGRPSQALMPPVIQVMIVCGCGDARILIGAVMPV